MRMLPALPNSGVRLVRSDLSGSPEIACKVQNVTNTQMATTLGVDRVSVSTVEHLLSALSVAGIDNIRIELDAPEVPISDGSAIEFFEALQAAGVRKQANVRQVLRLKHKVRVEMGDKWAEATPADVFSVAASVEFAHPSIGYQAFSYVEGKTEARELLAARTFGFLKEVEALKKLGLAQGGSLENAIVLDDTQVLNPDGLRFSDEFARHKVLDAIGDLMLAGHRIFGRIELCRSGHELHRRLTQAIVEASELVDYPVTQEMPLIGAQAREALQPVRRAAVS